MRHPEPADRLLRLIFPDRPTRVLDRVVLFSYRRFDGSRVGRFPRAWGFVGDRADDLRTLWVSRPKRRRLRRD